MKKNKLLPILSIFGILTAIIVNLANLQWAIIFIALFASGILFVYSKNIAETIYFFDKNLSLFTYFKFAFHHLSIKIVSFLLFLSAISRLMINFEIDKIIVMKTILIFCGTFHSLLLILAAINKWQQYLKYDYWGLAQSMLNFLNKNFGEKFLAKINMLEGICGLIFVIVVVPHIEYNELLKNIPWYIKFILFAEEGNARII